MTAKILGTKNPFSVNALKNYAKNRAREIVGFAGSGPIFES